MRRLFQFSWPASRQQWLAESMSAWTG
jgi:hypothetical protein